MKKYIAKPGAQFPQNKAQAIGERLYDYLRPKFGRIDKDIVVEDAKKRNSPLHSCGVFDWNVKRAAEQHWRSQAMHIINHIDFVEVECIPGKETRGTVEIGPMKAWHSVKDVDIHGVSRRIYVDTETVGAVDAYRLQVLEYVASRIEHWTKKFAEYQELEGIAREVKKLREKNEKMAEKMAKSNGKSKTKPREECVRA